MQIQPNFLNNHTFFSLVQQINDRSFPWHYAMSEGEPEQYCHLIYDDHHFSTFLNPPMLGVMQTIITDKLQAIATLRVKVNATPRNAPEQVWHRDWNISTPSKTCILYLNDNDGYTEFETGEKVMSQTNTAVIFDTNLRHRGVPATNVDRRMVLNISYFEK